MKRSIAAEHTTLPVHPKSQAAGFTTPTEARYRPGSVVIMGSHWGEKQGYGADTT